MVLQQLRGLVHKNLLLLYRRQMSMLIFLLTPSVALYGIASLAQLADKSAGEFGVTAMAVTKCRSFDANRQLSDAPCVTMGYAPSGGRAERVMRDVASSAGLEYGADVVGYVSEAALAEEMLAKPGSIEAGVVFDVGSCESAKATAAFATLRGACSMSLHPNLTDAACTDACRAIVVAAERACPLESSCAVAQSLYDNGVGLPASCRSPNAPLGTQINDPTC